MRLRQVYWIVFRKELRELLRDKRSLFWLFAPPIILPGLAICAGLFIGTQALRIVNDGFPVLIQNGDHAPDLVAAFKKDDSIDLVAPSTDPAADPFDKALAVVVVPDDFQDKLDHGETAHLQVLTRDNSVITYLAQAAVRSVIGGYKSQL